MSTLQVNAQMRDANAVKARHVRARGMIPVVVYGKRQTPFSIQIEERALETLLHHGGASQLVEVSVSEGGKHNILVRDIQRHPVTHHLMHADFYAVAMDEKQEVSVPLVGVGKPLALGAGLMVLQNHETVTIEALPADIPALIEIDLTSLSTEHPLRTTDLPKVAGVTYLMEDDEHIFTMVHTQGAIEEETAGEDVSVEPEVVKKGKQDEDAD